MFILRQ